MNLDLWPPGDTVDLTGSISGKVWWSTSMRVVSDSTELTVLHIAPGDTYRMPRTLAELPREEHSRISWQLRASGDWTLVERTWNTTHALTFMYPDKYFAIRMFWRDWTFLGWYVNFQRPYQRTPAGFDALDLILDIVVDPNDPEKRQVKDLELYEAGVQCGGITDIDVQGVENAQAEVKDLARLGLEPFLTDWRTWRPTP